VSTLPAIDEAAAPPAIAQITDEGATGPLGFVPPHTAVLSVFRGDTARAAPGARASTRLSAQRKDAGLVAESWMGLVVPSNRAQVLVQRLDRTAARLLQGHDSLSSGELPGRRLPQLGGGGKNRQAEDRVADCDIMSGKINAGLEEVLHSKIDDRRQNRAHREEELYA